MPINNEKRLRFITLFKQEITRTRGVGGSDHLTFCHYTYIYLTCLQQRSKNLHGKMGLPFCSPSCVKLLHKMIVTMVEYLMKYIYNVFC